MSAWIVSRQHIDVMVDAAIRSGLVEASQADEVGRMLWKENLVSVAYRYPRDKDGRRPGPTDFRDADVESYTFTPLPKEIVDVWNLNPDAALAKTVSCYEYQSCEHPGWQDSPACVLSSRLRELVREHDGYDDCIPWGWEVPLECQPKVDQGTLGAEDMKTQSFIERARASVAYDEDAKREFHRHGEAVLKQLAVALGYGPDQYDLRHNQGGIAVSGEITLHSDRLYVQFSQSPLGQNRGFLWRTCEGRKDYTGGPNRLAKWEELLDLPNLAFTMNSEKQTAAQELHKPELSVQRDDQETAQVMNEERGERIAGLLPYYPDTDAHSHFIDILTDAMHWCKANGESFSDALRIARDHFETEVAEERSEQEEPEAIALEKESEPYYYLRATDGVDETFDVYGPRAKWLGSFSFWDCAAQAECAARRVVGHLNRCGELTPAEARSVVENAIATYSREVRSTNTGPIQPLEAGHGELQPHQGQQPGQREHTGIDAEHQPEPEAQVVGKEPERNASRQPEQAVKAPSVSVSEKAKNTYTVYGWCLRPFRGDIEVEAESPEEAIALARAERKVQLNGSAGDCCPGQYRWDEFAVENEAGEEVLRVVLKDEQARLHDQVPESQKAPSEEQNPVLQVKTTAPPEGVLVKIAHEQLGIATLETRNSDSLDFHDVSVWALKAALLAAYHAGAKKQEVEPTRAKPERSSTATELKAPTPEERVNAKLVGELADTLDYLLEQTVDMDLKYGIGLSEGEEDARAKALAAIAKARGETTAVEQVPGETKGEQRVTPEVVEGRHFRATLYDNQSTPDMHPYEVLLSRKAHPRDTLLIDADQDQPCELVEVAARLATSRGNWDEGPREWESSHGEFKVVIDPGLHRLARIHFYESTAGEPEPRWVPVYGLDEAEDLLAVAKGVAALHMQLNTPARDFGPERTHVGTVERGRFRLEVFEDRRPFEPIYRATLYADGKATWPLDYESQCRRLRERLCEEGNVWLTNYLEARSLPPAGENDLPDLLKTLEDGEQLMVSLSRQAEQERDSGRKAAAATTKNPSYSEITNDRQGEKPETPGLKPPSGNERNEEMAENQNEKNGQSTKRQESGKNKPLHKETHGAVQVTIWDNGPDREPTVNFGRLYQSSGQWKVAQSFQRKHLSDLMKATEAAALALGQELQRRPQSSTMEKPQEICSVDSGRFSAVFSAEWSGTTGTHAYGAKILCDGKEVFAPMPGPMLAGLQVVARDGGLAWLADQVAKRNLPEPTTNDFQHFEKTLQASQALMGRFMESGHKKALADKSAVQDLGLDVSGVPEQEHETTHDRSR